MTVITGRIRCSLDVWAGTRCTPSSSNKLKNCTVTVQSFAHSLYNLLGFQPLAKERVLNSQSCPVRGIHRAMVQLALEP